jgi:L-asparaginase II
MLQRERFCAGKRAGMLGACRAEGSADSSWQAKDRAYHIRRNTNKEVNKMFPTENDLETTDGFHIPDAQGVTTLESKRDNTVDVALAERAYAQEDLLAGMAARRRFIAALR